MSKLKNCPLCGCSADLFNINSNDRSRREIYIKCRVCGLSTPHNYDQEKDAIRAWNKRASTPTCIYKRVDVEKNAWKCARCGGIWYVREGKQPHPQNVQYCFVCGSQVVDILDENGKSIKDGQTA